MPQSIQASSKGNNHYLATVIAVRKKYEPGKFENGELSEVSEQKNEV